MKKIGIFIIFFVAHSLYSVDGSLDLSFGNSGVVTTHISGSVINVITKVLLQPDTKIVAVGAASIGGTAIFALARYHEDGSLDTSFGSGGIVTTDFGGADTANAGLVQPNGKIVAAGQTDASGNDNFALARYNPDGSLDPSFGTNGLVTTNFGGTAADVAFAVLLQPDGKIIAVGRSDVGGTNDFALARYNTNGSLDISFGTNGLVTTNFGGADAAAAAILQPDGKIIAVGQSDAGGTLDFALARYNTNGSLDISFGTNGLVRTNFGGVDVALAVALQPDGKIIAAGISDTDFALARYNTNGSLDTSFGTNGLVITNVGGTDAATSVVLQSDGKIIAGGRSNVAGTTDFTLVRYTTNGSVDTTFGTNGFVTTSFGATDNLNGLLIQSDGKVVGGGQAGLTGTIDFALARYLIPSITISTLARDIRAKYFLLQ